MQHWSQKHLTEEENDKIIKPLHDENITLEIAKSTGRDHRSFKRFVSDTALFNERSNKGKMSKNSPVSLRIVRLIKREHMKTPL